MTDKLTRKLCIGYSDGSGCAEFDEDGSLKSGPYIRVDGDDETIIRGGTDENGSVEGILDPHYAALFLHAPEMLSVLERYMELNGPTAAEV